MSELFRRASVRHAASRLTGEVLIATPLPNRVLGLLALSCLAIAILFLCMATYTRKETVSGWLTPAGGLITVRSQSGGLVEATLVREGQTVAAGAPLVRLKLGDAGAQSEARDRLLGALATEDRAMSQRFAAEEARLKAGRENLVQRERFVLDQISEGERRVDLQSDRIVLARKAIANAEVLAAKGYGSAGAIDQRRSELLGLETELSSLKTQLLGLRRDLQDVRGGLRSSDAEEASLRAANAAEQAARAGRNAETEGKTDFVAMAPASSSILAVPVVKGQFVSSGAPLVVMMPSGAALEAELFVPSRAAGFIRAGQPVRLSYAAFSERKFGLAHGTVRAVSKTVMTPADVSGGRSEIKEPGFRVFVTLERPYVEAYGERVLLQPGMDVTASIILERRSILQWLFDPLLAAGRRI